MPSDPQTTCGCKTEWMGTTCHVFVCDKHIGMPEIKITTPYTLEDCLQQIVNYAEQAGAECMGYMFIRECLHRLLEAHHVRI